ncbi:hypothetical protein X973_15745 [Piscirickettsia salmonis]|nr:hypothetical protein X973_15745 [Piscirickettsia salmonis]
MATSSGMHDDALRIPRAGRVRRKDVNRRGSRGVAWMPSGGAGNWRNNITTLSRERKGATAAVAPARRSNGPRSGSGRGPGADGPGADQ